MKYWEEYQSKWGFGDGDAMPPDAEICRRVYVREINKLAKKNKSNVRLLAWDRDGVHNCRLILVIPSAWVKDVPPRKLYVGQWNGGWEPKDDNWQEAVTDQAMDDAIQTAFDMDLDSYVDVKVSLRK